MARLSKTNTPKQITYGRGKKLSKPKTQNKINNIKNPFILKRKNKLKVFRTLFATEEEKEIKKLGKKETNYRLIKGKIAKDIRTLFEQQEEKDYYKLKRVNIFWSNNYIEYESNGDKNRNLSLDEYLNKIKPYLCNIIVDLQNFDTWKIQ